MRKSQWLFLNDQSIIKTESFEELCRNKPNVLVRRRKMPTEDLIYSMINRKGLTLKLELRNYMKTFLLCAVKGGCRCQKTIVSATFKVPVEPIFSAPVFHRLLYTTKI